MTWAWLSAMALRRENERDVIDFLENDHVRIHSVSSPPYDVQKRVELGRALAMKPRCEAR